MVTCATCPAVATHGSIFHVYVVRYGKTVVERSVCRACEVEYRRQKAEKRAD